MDKVREYFRKKMVALKRNPSVIPLVILVVCCIVYTFNLSAHSFTALYAPPKSLGIYVFMSTLFSIMVIFSFLNIKGKKGRARLLFLGLVYAMIAVQLLFEILYIADLNASIIKDKIPITAVVANSMNSVYIHLGLLVLAALSIALLPFYSKLLQKINTAPPVKSEAIDAELALDEPDAE